MALSHDLYLVGTVPLTRPGDVFALVAETLGEHITRVPDGEIGDRRQWILGQYATLVTAKGMEPAAYPEEGMVRRFGYYIPVRAKSGVTSNDIEFGSLGYARNAIASYSTFRILKETGRIPKNWRFQVNLPMPMDVMLMVHPESRSVVEPAYERAMMKEVEEIQAAIPHGELAITWDEVHGVLLFEDPTTTYVPFHFKDRAQGVLERYARAGNAIAPDVELGFHLCYGSQNNVHVFEPRDLSACVELMNGVSELLRRSIDYVQMPVPIQHKSEEYYAPLRSLNRQKIKRVYLGLLHHEEDVAEVKNRIRVAEKILPDFGISTECGFGRYPNDWDIRELLEKHRKAVEEYM